MSEIYRIPEYFSTTLLAIFIIVGVSSGPTEQGSLHGLLEDVLGALQKGIQFVGEDYSSMNLDGLLGVRFCQGALLLATQDCETGELRCPQTLIKTLKNFSANLQEYSEKSLPYIQNQDAFYYKQFLPIINAPFIFDWTLKSLGNTSLALPGNDGVYRGDKGDRCISLLLGTHTDNRGNQWPQCSVSSECLNFMMEPMKRGYALTHQVFYFVLAEKFGCLDQMREIFKKHNIGSVKDLYRRLGQSMYVEVKGEVNGSKVEVIRRDLFLEQEVFGCLLGFKEFFQESWITMVLKWQKPEGCFGLSFLAESDADYQRILNSFKRRDDNPTGRKLMEDVKIREDCSSHSTGLGLGNFGLYLHYLVTRQFDQRSSSTTTYFGMK